MDFLKLPTPEAAAAAATAKKKSNNERNKWLNRVVVYRIVEFMKFWKHARVCSRRHRDGGGWWHRAHFCRCTPATLNTWYSTFPLVVRVERVCVSSANEGKKSRSPIFWILNWFCCCCRYAFRRRPTFNLVVFFIFVVVTNAQQNGNSTGCMHSWSKFFQIRKLLPQKWHARWWHTFIDSVGEALCLGRFCLSLVFRWTWSVIAILETPGYRVRNSETPINPSQYSALSFFFFFIIKMMKWQLEPCSLWPRSLKHWKHNINELRDS